MSDLTKCSGIGCNLRFACYRFKAIPNEPYQYYFPAPPVKNEGEVSQCDYFWPTEEFKTITNVRETNREELE